jgi:hypothetical protein
MSRLTLIAWALAVALGVAGCGPVSPTPAGYSAAATGAALTVEAVLTIAVRATSTAPPPTSGVQTAVETPTAPTEPAQGAECADRAAFVADVSIPDNTTLQPGEPFTKVWRLANIGTCTWTPNYALAFVGGERMGGPDEVQIGQAVGPGQSVDLTVDLVAPDQPGGYQGFWKLRSPAGMHFGVGEGGDHSFWVKIEVASAPATEEAGTAEP